MNPQSVLPAVASFLIACSSVASGATELLMAGGDRIVVVDAAKAERGETATLWTWRAADAPDLPAEAGKEFDHLDEIKPVDGGKKFLVCASNGGCALLERAGQRVLWRARVTNAHSLALLPRDRVVVASSLSGDRLVLFDLASSQPVFRTPLPSAHGVVWDEERRTLWALGFDELRAYGLAGWEGDHPSLELRASYPLPDKDGHDLRPVPGQAALLLTTEHTVQLFDRDSKTFAAHPVLGSMSGVKSVDIDPLTGRLVMSEWGPALRLFSPGGVIRLAGYRPYKVRWGSPAP